MIFSQVSPPIGLRFADKPLRAVYEENSSFNSAKIYQGDRLLFSLPTSPVSIWHEYPATISEDKSLLAIVSYRAIDIYLLQPQDSHDSLPVLLSLWLPKRFDSAQDQIESISFSTDSKWLAFVTSKGDEYFYELPSYYLTFKLSYEQILFIRVLQKIEQLENNRSDLSSNSTGKLLLDLYYQLSSSHALASFPVVDQKFFKSELDKLLTTGRQRRDRTIRGIEETFIAALDGYFFADEFVHLEKSLADIKSPRLQKKITKKMLKALAIAFPMADLTLYNQISTEDKIGSIKKNIQLAWQQYVSYQKDKDPEKFKDDFVKLMKEAYDDFKSYS